MSHIRCLLLVGLLALASVAQKPIVLVVDKETRPGVALALARGAETAAKEMKLDAYPVVVTDPAGAAAKDAFPGAIAFLCFAPPERAAAVQREAAQRGVPFLDLGKARLAKTLDIRGTADMESRAAAWWVFSPLAHHHVGIIAFNHPEEQAFAKAFAAEAKAHYPRKSVAALRHVSGSRPEAVAKELEKDIAEGATAFVVAGNATEGKLVAEAAKLITPPPVIMLASSALGFEARDKKDQAGGPFFPEGTVVLDLDLPSPGALAEFPAAAPILALADEGGPWTLAAFDAVAMLRKGIAAAADGPIVADPATGVRGGAFSKEGRALSHTPLMVSGGRFVACAPLDPKKPQARPVVAPYDPEEGIGPLSRWSTLTFKSNPDTTRCLFSYTDGKVRSIDADLNKMKIGTMGKYPVIDHLVREKLIARTMSVTAEKYGLNPDGSLVPGKSFQISFVAHMDKVKVKKTWPCYVAGDDPAAGGRAFGSYCFIYSTFIERTIFSPEHFDLFDDEINATDLPFLTGVGADESSYTLGSRPDTIFRLIDNYAGSMGLTAAHEIGHLSGLGHDEDDPVGIMNVKEGAGIRYEAGHFTPTNEAALEKTLGRTPEKKKH